MFRTLFEDTDVVASAVPPQPTFRNMGTAPVASTVLPQPTFRNMGTVPVASAVPSTVPPQPTLHWNAGTRDPGYTPEPPHHLSTIPLSLMVKPPPKQPRQTPPSTIQIHGTHGIPGTLPYSPFIHVFIFQVDTRTGQRHFYMHFLLNNARQLRDILSATHALTNIEIVCVGRIYADGDLYTEYTFKDGTGLAIEINGQEVQPNKVIKIYKDGSQIMKIRWVQQANNNYMMELQAMPYTFPLTWLSATQEKNAPVLTYAVYDRVRRGPRGGLLPRAAAFEDYRNPEYFPLKATNVEIVGRKFPLIPSRKYFLKVSGAGSGVSGVATAISPTAWMTITMVFWLDELPRPREGASMHLLFVQEPFSFCLEYCLKGQIGFGSPEGVYIRGEAGGQPTYSRVPIQAKTWYNFIIAFRGTDVSFGVYTVAAATETERTQMTLSRGILANSGEIFQSMRLSGAMHIGYGFHGLVAWVNYFDKGCDFEAGLDKEFTDNWLTTWYR
jgi:hypothetical protein